MAASNINRVIITGNLTADPELRSLPSGMAVCKLRVACNTRRKDGPSGEWVDKPNYFDVTVWGAQGENASRYLTKGRGVAIGASFPGAYDTRKKNVAIVRRARVVGRRGRARTDPRTAWRRRQRADRLHDVRDRVAPDGRSRRRPCRVAHRVLDT